MMLNKTIKELTQVMHSSLEKLMYVNEIMDGSLTLQQYQKMMLTNYLVTSKFEQKLIDAIDTETALKLCLNDRSKLASLTKDLLALNISTQALESELFEPSMSFSLGCLYVLEGATLGGDIIIKKLKQNKQLIPHQLQFNYYQVYGEKLFDNWKKFCELINNQPYKNHLQIIEGAKYMYTQFNNTMLLK